MGRGVQLLIMAFTLAIVCSAAVEAMLVIAVAAHK